MHSTTIKSGHFSDLLSPDMGESYNNSHGGSNSSDNGSVSGENELLRPDSHQEMRAGRQRRHSTSRSNSRSVSRERSPSVNREKMLELASTNQGKKRTQKNPAIVACHLCDKKFTRNYNLNSHLRTHANEPNHSRNGSMRSTTIKSGHFSDLLSPDMGESYNNSHGGSNSSDNGSVNGENELLRPDSHKEMRAGRQRRHSTSRSNSRSVSRERSPSVNREKMLELASTNQGKKRTQKNPAIVACHLCDKKFTRNYNLNSHLRTHANERPFECTLCHRTFVRQYDMNRHMALHSGEKKYECRGTLKDGVTVWGCGKRFARTDALGRHFKTEAGKECIRPLVEENERERMAQKEANPEQIEEKS
ncbi:CRZ1 [Cyberlindnera jadinii]|uniref:CRZ1 protein n=1 Tax=Cyberlindnera jadinii (strain ATCC 18201 / CBS 1600 / BCRC 20928 / JCM 3617 / NBRC 0987 / NRRL Y-1542) TaxID=983966 RepID=A0A0H5BYH2_CYBJN|nr:CRZ1 [Cyberlindnera jadinii]